VAAVWSHVVMDWATSFGTPIWLPFSHQNGAMDLLSNWNWVYWIIGGGVLWYLRQHRHQSRRVVICCLGVLLGFQMLGKGLSSHLMRHEKNMAVLPHLGNPFLWRVHVSDQENKMYRLYHVAPFLGRRTFVKEIGFMEKTPIIQAAFSDPQVRLFFKHNRWPVAEVEEIPSGWLVRISNLLYWWQDQWGERLEARLNKKLEVVETKKVFQVW